MVKVNAFSILIKMAGVQCGQVVNINNVLVSGIQTTEEDCGGGGGCNFDYTFAEFGFPDRLGAAAARILFDLQNYQDLTATMIKLEYEDFCGSGCTKAFVYDENMTLLASQGNPPANGNFIPREFLFEDPDVLVAARFVAFSSCEGFLYCFDMTFEN